MNRRYEGVGRLPPTVDVQRIRTLPSSFTGYNRPSLSNSTGSAFAAHIVRQVMVLSFHVEVSSSEPTTFWLFFQINFLQPLQSKFPRTRQNLHGRIERGS